MPNCACGIPDYRCHHCTDDEPVTPAPVQSTRHTAPAREAPERYTPAERTQLRDAGRRFE